MRIRRTRSGLTVNAVAGTNVVLFGIDLQEEKRGGCLGFAVQREDHVENETTWLRGIKTFEETEPYPDLAVKVRSRDHPFQSFQWADYAAKPGYEYTYTVLPLYGTPARLEEGDPVSVRVQMEREWGMPHSVFFNRGAVASQEYARRFQNRRPGEVGEAARRWLSRGLLEAILAFIRRADGRRYGLYAALYELEWAPVLQALAEAAGTDATVRIVYDAIPGAGKPAPDNLAAIRAAGVEPLTTGRARGRLMHNKFFVLTEDGQPVAVLTGSTNLTENGIFGHSNCAHVVEDPDVAGTYLDYWRWLGGDPPVPEAKQWAERENAAPPEPWNQPVTPVFSPRSGLGVLDWYARIAGGAERALFMTFAFGMHRSFQQVYDQDDGVLRFALMEKEGNGKWLERGRQDIRRIRRRPNVVVALGNNLRLNAFDRWLKEIDRIRDKVNVRWIHTKYMLVDPLGEQPVVVTGSANFSEASTDSNDENMLVIRGDTRIADIYLGEFMRLYSHYAFREAVKINLERGVADDEWRPNYLERDDGWQRDYFTPGTSRFLRRRYFAGG